LLFRPHPNPLPPGEGGRFDPAPSTHRLVAAANRPCVIPSPRGPRGGSGVDLLSSEIVPLRAYAAGQIVAPSLFLAGFALCFPVARAGISIPFRFDFAFDRIPTQLAGVFGGQLVSTDLTSHVERDFIPIQLPI
jgi:hypothetical protein